MTAEKTRALRVYEKMGDIGDRYILDAEIPAAVLPVPAPRFGGLRRFLNSGWGAAAISLLVALCVLTAIIRAGQNTPPAVTDIPTDTESDTVPETDPESESDTEPEFESETETEPETEPESVRYLEYEEYVAVEPVPPTRWGAIYREGDFTYCSNGDGTCTVVGWWAPKDTAELVIPTHSPLGEPVVRIGEYFAMDFYDLTSIRIPATVREYGRYAFYGMKDRTDAPPTLSAYGEGDAYVQNNCLIDPATKTLLLGYGPIPADGSVTRLGAYSMQRVPDGGIPDCITYVGMGALGYSWHRWGTSEYGDSIYVGSTENPYMILVSAKKGVTSLTAHPDTKILYGCGEFPGESIGDYYGFSSLTELILPEGLLQISGTALMWSKLSVLHIPSTVTHIEESALAYSVCEKVTVSPQNPVYRADGNCLIEVPTGTLIGTGKTFTLPHNGSIRRIGSSAFRDYSGYNADGAKLSLTLPDSVEEIGKEAFLYAGITVTNLPESLRVLEYDANLDYEWTGNGPLPLPDGLIYMDSGAFSRNVAESVILPEGLRGMGSSVYSRLATKATELRFPKGMTRIGTAAVCMDSSAVTDMYVHGDVTYVGVSLVHGMETSVRIHYDGTVAEWNAILAGEMDLEYFNGATLTVICSDGEIRLK